MGQSPSRRRREAAALLAASLAAGCATAQGHLVDLSLEELGDVIITSASKREQRLADAPASVFVITADDIRRTGVTSLPEALRLAPNLHVARVYGSGYAISAQGFNGNSANKLLVMIDGRSVYTPLFAGVFWDVQDLPLEDIERIEVSSGPGGTVWGVNAVNGVINIVTRSAAATRGTLVSAAVGTRERQATLRQGMAAPGGGDMRVYLRRSDLGHGETADGRAIDDAGHLTQAGFRADWDRAGERLTLLGQAYRGEHGQPPPGSISVTGYPMALDTITLSGANLLGRWQRPLPSLGGDISVQGYLDRTVRRVPPSFDETLQIADLELQLTLQPAPGHTLTLGANHRRSRDRLAHHTPIFAFLPERLGQAWTSVFVQDELALGEGLRLTAGVRAERNDYTGLEWLPTLRLAWKPAPEQLWWVSLSHAVRAPSRLDRDAYIPAQPPFVLYGGPQFRAETADSLQLGYRGQPLRALSLSVTAFISDYDRLRTQELAPSGTQVYFGNGLQGQVHGVEAWGVLQATPALRLHAGLTLMRPHLSYKTGSIDTAGSLEATEGAMPRQLLQLRAALNLPRDCELDAVLRHVGALSSPDVPAYTALDLRLARRLGSNVELALTGRNLLGSHGEFGPVETRAEFGRAVLLQLRATLP